MYYADMHDIPIAVRKPGTKNTKYTIVIKIMFVLVAHATLTMHSARIQHHLFFFFLFTFSLFIATLRLVDGPDELSGRVEIFVNGTWSTVCDDSWDMNDAQVVCRQLGHGTAKQADAHFGQGTGPIAFDGFECTGDEQYLENCSHAGLFNHDCVHQEDAGVVCNSNGGFTT